jgi:hypothetical protein
VDFRLTAQQAQLRSRARDFAWQTMLLAACCDREAVQPPTAGGAVLAGEGRASLDTLAGMPARAAELEGGSQLTNLRPNGFGKAQSFRTVRADAAAFCTGCARPARGLATGSSCGSTISRSVCQPCGRASSAAPRSRASPSALQTAKVTGCGAGSRGGSR